MKNWRTARLVEAALRRPEILPADTGQGAPSLIFKKKNRHEIRASDHDSFEPYNHGETITQPPQNGQEKSLQQLSSGQSVESGEIQQPLSRKTTKTEPINQLSFWENAETGPVQEFSSSGEKDQEDAVQRLSFRSGSEAGPEQLLSPKQSVGMDSLEMSFCQDEYLKEILDLSISEDAADAALDINFSLINEAISIPPLYRNTQNAMLNDDNSLNPKKNCLVACGQDIGEKPAQHPSSEQSAEGERIQQPQKSLTENINSELVAQEEYLDFSMLSDDSVADPDFVINQNIVSTSSPDLTITTPNLDLNDNTSEASSRRCRTQKKRNERDANKHPIILQKCSEKCKRKCSSLSDDERREIWKKYWSLDYTSRRKWLASSMKISSVKRRTVQPDDDRVPKKYKKTESRFFYLKKGTEDVNVCRLFMLNTLGYTNDSVLTELSKAIKNEPLFGSVKENRGGKNQKTCNAQDIINHIESYNPTVSHYRRKNAPRAKYLPIGLTVTAMFDDFKKKHPGGRSLETYRKMLKEMHVSLHSPKGDRCYDCMIYEQQENPDQESRDTYKTHKEKANLATITYRMDSWTPEAKNTKVFSVDLQKVLLIPQMPSCKESFFVSRLAVFNLTFSPLKKASQQYKSYCCVWHEASAGREAKHIVDAINRLFEEERDTEHFIFWMDNCSAQNKNWFLYTSLVSIVNREHENPKSVCVKYLTKGHTHMTADAVHGNIEKHLRRVREIDDFSDLKHAIKESRSNMEVLEVTTFHDWPKKKRTATKAEDPLKEFLLAPLVEAKFEKCSRNLKYKTTFTEEYKEIDFIQKRCKLPLHPTVSNVRGVLSSKKKEIVEKLVPLLKDNRHQFWHELPESDTNIDLVIDGDVMVDE